MRTMRISIAAQLAVLLAMALGPAVSGTPQSRAKAPRSHMLRRLELIIPEVNFKEAKLEDIVNFLSEKADVNIVINPAVYASAVLPRAISSVPPAGEESTPHAAPAAALESDQDRPTARRQPPAETRGITIHLKNVPLKVVLKYVLTYENLRYIVEDYAIVIVPVDWVPHEELSTEVFRLRTGGFESPKPARQHAGTPF